MRDIFLWIQFYHSHSKLIPSFLMRKNEKKRILPTRDQKIVTLDWMNPILNDGKAEGRGNFLNKGQPLRFFLLLIQLSFHCFFIIQYSFTIWNECRMSATIHSPQPPLQRGLGGMDWRTHSKLILLTEWNKNECDNPIPPTPSAEGVGGNGLTH